MGKYKLNFLYYKIFIIMSMNIDDLILVFNKYSTDTSKEEFGEQDAAPASSGGASSGGGAKPVYPTVTKWESGVARTGPANQIGLTKWSEIVKINRGKANTLL
jgi:hypothetical protein